MYLLRRSPLGVVISALVVVAVLIFGVTRVVNRISDTADSIGSDSSTGGADADSLYRSDNFATALKAVQGKVGPGGDILELRIEAKKADFTVREGKGEDATGWRAKAGNGGDLDSFGVDVVGEGSLANSAIPAADVTVAAIGRMEASALERDPEAKLNTIQFFTLEVDPGSRKPEWRMNVHGNLYLAALNGTRFHRPGDGAGTIDDPELGGAEKRALRLSHCISTAQGDVAKIQRCQKKFLR
jgi:hypothetical protein